ncbi:MAG: DUF3108 domain-containing protein [Gammaproteobacteria bacterium]
MKAKWVQGLLSGALLCGALTTASAVEPVIPLYHADYSLTRNDFVIGTPRFELMQDHDGGYIYRSVTLPAGLAKLIAGDTVITETSRFKMTDGKAVPLEYSYLQTSGSGDKRKTDHSEVIQFDWAKGLAHSDDDGRKQNTKLRPNMYDVFLIRLVLPLDAAANRLATGYSVLDHREVVSYSLKKLSDTTLKTDAGQFNTEVLELRDTGKGLTLTLWLAPKLHYLPVQIQQAQTDKPTFTMVLTEIKFDNKNSM